MLASRLAPRISRILSRVTERHSAKPIHPSPRVRTFGAVQEIVGRHRSAYRIIAVKAAIWLVLRILGFAMMAAAMLPLLPWRPAFGTRTIGAIAFEVATRLRGMGRWFFHDAWKEIGQSTYYNPSRPADWHLLVAGLVVLALARASGPVAWLITTIGWPVLARRLRVTVEPDWVTVHRLFVPLRIKRDPFGRVTFRMVPLKERSPRLALFIQKHAWTIGLLAGEPAWLELVHGNRTFRLALFMRADLAERWMVACQHAMASQAAAFINPPPPRP